MRSRYTFVTADDLVHLKELRLRCTGVGIDTAWLEQFIDTHAKEVDQHSETGTDEPMDFTYSFDGPSP